MNAADSTTVLVPAGHQLLITATASTLGQVVRLAHSTGEESQSTFELAGADATFGPYTHAEHFAIYCSAGPLTYSVERYDYSQSLVAAPAAITEHTDDYTLVLADALKRVDMNKAGANTLTIPPNSAAAFDIGTMISGVQSGAGATTIAAGAGVTIVKPASRTLVVSERHEGYSLHKVATNTWRVLVG